jgi:phytanoyl-CoA hydroxylase
MNMSLASMNNSFRLTSSERQQLTRDGYVVREAVFDPAECAAIAASVEALIDDLMAAKRSKKEVFGSYMFEVQRELGSVVKWEPDSPDIIMGVEPFAHISKSLHEWGLDPRLIDPSKDVVGQDDIELFTEKLTMKRAYKGGPIVLHQDYPYWAPMTEVADRIMTALIYLDDATLDNGCLEVVPGSHAVGFHSGRKRVSGFGANELDEATFDTSRLVPVEAKAGTVIYFGPFLVHRSLPNRSGADRRALLYSYQPAGYPHARVLNRLVQGETVAR